MITFNRQHCTVAIGLFKGLLEHQQALEDGALAGGIGAEDEGQGPDGQGFRAGEGLKIGELEFGQHGASLGISSCLVNYGSKPRANFSEAKY